MDFCELICSIYTIQHQNLYFREPQRLMMSVSLTEIITVHFLLYINISNGSQKRQLLSVNPDSLVLVCIRNFFRSSETHFVSGYIFDSGFSNIFERKHQRKHSQCSCESEFHFRNLFRNQEGFCRSFESF